MVGGALMTAPDSAGRADGAGGAGVGGGAGWSATAWSRAGWRAHLEVPDGDLDELVERLGAATILDLAAESARRFPDRVAVTVDGEPVTHAGLAAGAGQVAAWLAARTEPGDRVLLAAGSSLGFLRCYLGALRAGTVVVLANPGYTAAELGHLVTDSGAVLAFADPGPARLLAALGPGVDPPETADVRTLPDQAGPVPALAARPGEVALLAYTSGTTGRPKGVP